MWLYSRYKDIRGIFGAARFYGAGILPTVARFTRLTFRDLYSADEVFLLGLLNPKLTDEDLSKYTSKEKLLFAQRRLNAQESFSLTEDKVEFFLKCHASALATPDILAIFSTEKGEFGDIKTLHNETELSDFFRDRDDFEFILKPADGLHGLGIRSLAWKDEELREDQKPCDCADLLSHMTASGHSVWILQPTLKAHTDIAQLSGLDRLQTARVVSYVDQQGDVQIPIAYLRIIAGDTIFDNFNFGSSGNLVATVDLATGHLKSVLGANPEGHGMVEIKNHPTTGRSFSDFTVPFAAEISSLVKSAAREFTPLRTIGWDVGITNDGLHLIEGNVTWDPLPTRENLGAIVRSLV